VFKKGNYTQYDMSNIDMSFVLKTTYGGFVSFHQSWYIIGPANVIGENIIVLSRVGFKLCGIVQDQKHTNQDLWNKDEEEKKESRTSCRRTTLGCLSTLSVPISLLICRHDDEWNRPSAKESQRREMKRDVICARVWCSPALGEDLVTVEELDGKVATGGVVACVLDLAEVALPEGPPDLIPPPAATNTCTPPQPRHSPFTIRNRLRRQRPLSGTLRHRTSVAARRRQIRWPQMLRRSRGAGHGGSGDSWSRAWRRTNGRERPNKRKQIQHLCHLLDVLHIYSL
jgi:hypothetical protein